MSLSGGESNRYERTNAEAFIQLVTGSTTLDRRIPEVVVIIDYDTLTDRLHQHGVCERPAASLCPRPS